MKYSVSISSSEDGEFVAECGDLGLTGTGLSRTNALDALKRNIMFNLEYCPCSSLEEGDMEFDVH